MKRMKDKRVRDELLADTQRDEILKKRRVLWGRKMCLLLNSLNLK